MTRERPILLRLFLLGVLLTPPVLGLMWGDYFEDPFYDAYIATQNLAAGRGLAFHAASGVQSPLVSPLFIGILTLFIPVIAAVRLGLILSAVGWGVTAIVVYKLGIWLERPLAAMLAAALVASSPIIFLILGGTASWAVTLTGMAILLSLRPKVEGGAKTFPIGALLLLLLGIHFDPSTFIFLIIASAIQWNERRWSWRHLLTWLVASGSWFVFQAWRFGELLETRPLPERYGLQSLVLHSELYWLFLPLLMAGILSFAQTTPVQRKKLWAYIAWLLVSVLIGSPLAPALVTVTGLFLASLGIEWAIQRIVEHNLFQLTQARLTLTLALLFISPLLIAQVSSLWKHYRARPLAQFELEEQVAGWLQRHSEPTALLFASRRIGYLADRATIPAEISQRTSSEWAELLSMLMDAEPDFVVSRRTIDWSFVTGAGWFQEHYQPQQQLTAAYGQTSPATIWQSAPTPFDIGLLQPADATVPGHMKLVGYKYEPQQIVPGDDIYVTLHLQATQPITTGLDTAIFVVHPINREIWAWQDAPTPRAIPTEWWQTGQVVAERFRIPTEPELPFGAYVLELLWRENNGANSPVYLGNDTEMLDRLQLGYIAVPPPVDSTDAIPANARFGDQIMLSGFEITGRVAPGEHIGLILYWSALRVPEQNYAVFVHLLDQAEQLIANHDAQPMENRFPTKGWRPGVTVRDGHPLSLPPDLPNGEYKIMVGLYLQRTGERLPVWDNKGIEQAGGALPLSTIEFNR